MFCYICLESVIAIFDYKMPLRCTRGGSGWLRGRFSSLKVVWASQGAAQGCGGATSLEGEKPLDVALSALVPLVWCCLLKGWTQ